jgi:hypothetical protein
MDWLFEVVLDYGEDHLRRVPTSPALPLQSQRRVRAAATPGRPWAARPDPFTWHRAGFPITTRRRCRRFLIFHRFPELGD